MCGRHFLLGKPYIIPRRNMPNNFDTVNRNKKKHPTFFHPDDFADGIDVNALGTQNDRLHWLCAIWRQHGQTCIVSIRSVSPCDLVSYVVNRWWLFKTSSCDQFHCFLQPNIQTHHKIALNRYRFTNKYSEWVYQCQVLKNWHKNETNRRRNIKMCSTFIKKHKTIRDLFSSKINECVNVH